MGSPPLLRRLNSAPLLRTIRSEGPISRSELARVTGLSEAVIIGGGVSRAGSRLLEPLTSRIPELVPVAPRVLLSALGEDAVALGAVRLEVQAVEERLFDVAATEGA